MKKMESTDILKFRTSPIIEASAAGSRPATPAPEPEREMSRDVAHELNNVLTIVRGYTERLILKHSHNPDLRPELQLILDNARRAESIVRSASRIKRANPVAG